MSSRYLPPGFGVTYGENWHDGTPEGAAAYALYTNNNPFPQLGDQGFAYVPPTAPSYKPYFGTDAPLLPPVGTTLPPNGGSTPADPPIGFSPVANNIDMGALGGAVTASGLCDRLPPGYREACKAAAAAAGVLGGNNANPGGLTPSCSPGYTWNATLKQCVKITAALPGGDPLTQTRNVTTTGGLGLAAIQPIQVGYIQRKDGVTSPIMRCPARYVLGQDYLCYPKSMIPNQLRAHPRGTRPLLTGGDVKVLRRAKSLEKKVSKLQSKYGKKVCHCGPKRGKKK